MSRFHTLLGASLHTPLRVEQLDETHWRLLETLVYESDLVGMIFVPAGFVTDFASVGRWPVVYLLAGGVGDRAAVLHDWLYRNPMGWRRAVIDAVFYEALRVCAISVWRAWSMWVGVRAGGWVAWNQYRRDASEGAPS